MDKFSVLIPSYREQDRLYNLVKTILKDKMANKLEKIVVVSPDKDLALPKSVKITLIQEKERKGKYYAIRLGLKKIKSKIVVMLSSDIRMRKNFLYFLLRHFKDPKVGMVVGRPMADKNSKIYPFSKIIWDLHHLLCLKEPKGTEICAFRKIFNYFPKVSADEVFIEYKIRKAGFRIIYEPKAFGYTKIPNTLKHFFLQRKRIHFGHIYIKNFYFFPTSSVRNDILLLIVFNYFYTIKKIKSLFLFFILLITEFFLRINAMFEFHLLKEKYLIWKK
ncbi:MAG: glycosyltransferase [Candidatus Aenigmatarchaeota archaeon]